MKINDLVNLNEMAIPVKEGSKVWKKINDLLNADKYKEAAEFYLKSGGNVRGVKRTWNVAQGNTKLSGDKIPGPIFGTLDKKHSYDKFMKAMPEEEQKAKKNKVKKTIEQKEKDSESGATAAGYKEASDVVKSKIAGADSNASHKRTDYIKAYGKFTGKHGDEAVKELEARAKELGQTAKDIAKYEVLKAKPFKDRTSEERAEFTRLEKITAKKRNPFVITKEAKEDFESAQTAKELKDVFQKYIKNNIRIDNRDMVVSLLKKIKNVSSGKEAVDLNLDLKRIFRNKNNSKSIDDLIKKYNTEIGKGLEHLKGIDEVLDKYNLGKDISKEDIKKLSIEVEKMLPTMKQDQKFDLKGYSVYATASRKLKELLAKKDEPNIDDIEDAIEPMSKYHENLKKEAKKRTIKEDIMFNTNEKTLNEGIFFFKDSNKLKKYIKKLSKNVDEIKDEDEKQDFLNFLEEVKKTAIEFELLEKKFKKAPLSAKAAIKKEHIEKTREFSTLIKDADTITPILKKIGKVAIFAGLLYFVGTRFAGINPEVTSGNKMADTIVGNSVDNSNWKSNAALGLRSAALDKKAAGITISSNKAGREAAKLLKLQYGKYISKGALNLEARKAASEYFQNAWEDHK